MSEKRLQVNYDEEIDVLHLITEEGPEEESVELAPGFIVELNKNGKVVGVEILNASQILGPMMNKFRRAG